MTTAINQLDFHHYLPPYRSLLTPNSKYDYKTHQLIPYDSNMSIIQELSKFQNKKSSKIKMKYKSLLSDVTRKKSILSLKFTNSAAPVPTTAVYIAPIAKWDPVTLVGLPTEIIDLILAQVDHDDYQNLLLVNKLFYIQTKPFLYESIMFDSSYRFAQFITMLRINPKLGKLVKRMDLSSIKPSNYEVDDDEAAADYKTLAGWRDWKFKSNPLYGTSLIPLSKTYTNSSIRTLGSLNSQMTTGSSYSHSNSHSKKRKFKNLFHRESNKRPEASRPHQPLLEILNLNQSHPIINKFLINYSNSKDLPVGYLLHLIKLCPNLTHLNLGNLSLSVDYTIDDYVKYRNYDIKSNYPVNLKYTTDSIYTGGFNSSTLFNNKVNNGSIFGFNIYENASMVCTNGSVSERLSLETNKLYLSDLNLKSINPAHLNRISETEILKEIISLPKLDYLNLSSLIWLDRANVKWLLQNLEQVFQEKNLILDLSNSGMNKNLNWARAIDNWDMANKIIHGEYLNEYEEFLREERVRRGRVGENYF